MVVLGCLLFLWVPWSGVRARKMASHGKMETGLSEKKETHIQRMAVTEGWSAYRQCQD